MKQPDRTLGHQPLFVEATFSGGSVHFGGTFSGGAVSFGRVTFSGGQVWFDSATFGGTEVRVRGATFSGGEVTPFRGWLAEEHGFITV